MGSEDTTKSVQAALADIEACCEEAAKAVERNQTLKTLELIEKICDRIYDAGNWCEPRFYTAHPVSGGLRMTFKATQHTGACAPTRWEFELDFPTGNVDEMLDTVEHRWQTLWDAAIKSHD